MTGNGCNLLWHFEMHTAEQVLESWPAARPQPLLASRSTFSTTAGKLPGGLPLRQLLKHALRERLLLGWSLCCAGWCCMDGVVALAHSVSRCLRVNAVSSCKRRLCRPLVHAQHMHHWCRPGQALTQTAPVPVALVASRRVPEGLSPPRWAAGVCASARKCPACPSLRAAMCASQRRYNSYKRWQGWELMTECPAVLAVHGYTTLR